ncbi:sulfatase-like hydrolase/transferase [Spirosoma luteum]|uniref:sulfatase-like hydrolase/transferase n=1 Tax=Spirosoma luteum TaxID=431553 RepID=UPI00036C102B|nr:sulfatase-like hydrolase/transferase [Spirosoma luteum]
MISCLPLAKNVAAITDATLLQPYGTSLMGKAIFSPTQRCYVPTGRWLMGILPVLLCFLATLTAPAQDRPNILWLTFEDTSPEFIGCYGNGVAKTPVMDRLAAEGIRFTAAYSTGSVCSPSRNALILGCKTYTLGTGNHRSNYPIPHTMTGFPKYLRDATERGPGYYTTNNSKTDYNTSAAKRIIQESWDESSEQAGWWKRRNGQPFFSVFNSISSHQSRTMTEPFAQYKKQIIDQLAESQQTKDEDVLLPPFFRDSPAMRKQTARIYNSITKTDTEFGELLARLEKEGLRENTIIFVFADHGEGMPDAKTNGKGLGHRVPFIAWFPEKYKHLSPWKQPGAVTDEKIDFTDLGPTVLSLAGVDSPAYMQGRSLVGKNGTPERRKPEPTYLFLSSDRSDESYDLTRTVIKGHYAYTRVFMPYVPELRYLQYMDVGEITQHIRSDFRDKKLNTVQQRILLPRPAEMLYDLEKDPWEMDNLAQKKGYESLLNEFRSQLRTHVLSQRDVLFLPELEIARLSETTTAYTFRQQDVNYPIQDIYEAASVSGFRDAATLKKQIGLLKSRTPLVRYWALMGLRSQSKPALVPYQVQLTAALTDSYPLNQVVAASILNGHFDDKPAKTVLLKHLDSPDDNVANVVMQQLMYQPNASDWVPDIEQFYTVKKTLQAKPYHALLSASVFLYAHGGRTLRNETE